MNFAGYSEEEIKRWLWLRAVEWEALPAYISQPLAPLFFIYFRWYFVVLAVVAIGAVWCLVRNSFVSVNLASVACLFVVWTKWPAAVGSSIYLFFHHQVAAGIVALIWPLVAGFTCVPGKVGTAELALAKKIGFVPPDAEL